jgi:hypothetical protein
MFRPDPNGASVEQVIGKLTDILMEVPHDSPRAKKLAEMIRGLQEIGKKGHAKPAAPGVEIGPP